MIQRSGYVQGRVSLNAVSTAGYVHEMKYQLAKYDLEGNFLGWEALDQQLLICPASYEEALSFRRFGTTIINSCTFDLTKITDNSTADYPNNVNVFYDMFYEDTNGNLLDVPVVIRNFKDSSGSSPNSGTGLDQWRLTRRFFVWDAISGVQGDG